MSILTALSMSMMHTKSYYSTILGFSIGRKRNICTLMYNQVYEYKIAKLNDAFSQLTALLHVRLTFDKKKEEI